MTLYYEALARLLVALVLALSGLAGQVTLSTEPAEPVQYRSPCQEDEDWLTVDYRTAGTIEDASGVSRLCVNPENHH